MILSILNVAVRLKSNFYAAFQQKLLHRQSRPFGHSTYMIMPFCISPSVVQTMGPAYPVSPFEQFLLCMQRLYM